MAGKTVGGRILLLVTIVALRYSSHFRPTWTFQLNEGDERSMDGREVGQAQEEE